MTITLISEDDYDEHLEEAHNPPASDLPQEDFDQEYHALFDRVATLLDGHGKNDPYEQGDYYLEPGITESRGLGFVITNDAIVTGTLLGRLQDIVARFAPDWEIHVGSSEFEYGIFIGPDSVRLHRDRGDVLPQLDEFIQS
jgi:hypothetical protein